MQKAKKYKWQDTNMALFGSDIEKEIKKKSAEGEPAWTEGGGVGKKPGVNVWRIEKFEVKKWKKKGKFHTGDSYIVLNTYEVEVENDTGAKDKKLAWDIHFWIGKESTQDEYGTAAYKTVELDHFLNDAAVQHREVQENESKSFLEIFSDITYLKGGIESGFNHVEEEKREPVLLHVKGVRGAVILKEIERKKNQMNSGDVFILDDFNNKIVYQWNGKGANVHEKMKAQEVCHGIQSGRGDGTKVEVLEEESSHDHEEFWKLVPGEWKLFGLVPLVKYNLKEEDEGGIDSAVKKFVPKLFKLSDKSGKLKFTKIATSDKNYKFKRGHLSNNTNDVLIMDEGFAVWIWIGKGASSSEKGQAFMYATKYLKQYKRPNIMPIHRITEGNERPKFTEHFVDGEVKSGGCTIQ